MAFLRNLRRPGVKERGQQREKKTVGELRGEAEAVVGNDLARSPLQQIGPADRRAQGARGIGQRIRPPRGPLDPVRDVAAPRTTPVPTVGVQDGASLAGNDSADASCTRS
jgi:hypothetical protein